MVDGADAVRLVRDELRSNLTDYNTYRADRGLEWIHDDFPRHDASLPRIGVIEVGGPLTSYSVGSVSRSHDLRIQVIIKVGTKQRFEVDGTLLRSEKLLSVLVEQVIKTINDAQSTFCDAGFDHIVPVDVVADDKSDQMIRIVDFIAKFKRG